MPPWKAASAEQALREAARVLERETQDQLLLWLQSLGARALESLVRIYLQREGFSLLSALPPSRGLGKLVVEDPEPEFDEARVLAKALVVPGTPAGVGVDSGAGGAVARERRREASVAGARVKKTASSVEFWA